MPRRPAGPLMARARDADGFARLRELCDGDPASRPPAPGQHRYRAALIVAAKGGSSADITVGDVLELLDVEAAAHASRMAHAPCSTGCCTRWGSSAPDAPPTLRELRTRGQRTPEELIDRYRPGLPPGPRPAGGLPARAPARAGLHQPAILANYLGKLFWADLERHHPGIDSLHLPAEVADGLEAAAAHHQPQTITTADRREDRGHRRADQLPRVPDPGPGVLPGSGPLGGRGPGPLGPVGRALPGRRGGDQPAQGRAAPQGPDGRPHPRTAARPAGPGRAPSTSGARPPPRCSPPPARPSPARPFTAAGQTLTRCVVDHAPAPERIWADDPATGKRRDLSREEDHAFWAWAASRCCAPPASASRN